MNKRWIITGANGYLGGELCRGLHDRGDKVLGVARAERSLNSLESLGISCHTYEDIPAILSKGDIFIHCAGKVGDDGTWDDFSSVNIDWSTSLFDQAAELGVACFIYVSSIAALGYKNRPGNEVLKESSVPELVDGEQYGRSKLLAEQALQNRARNTAVRLIIFRPGLIYGRRRFASQKSWFRRGIAIDSHQRVPLVHIDNFLDAVAKTTDNSETAGMFTVVDMEQPTLRDLNALKIQHGLLRYHPWRVGKAGFWLLYLLKSIVQSLRGRSNVVPKGYALTQYYFLTRRLLYSTEKLGRLGWVQKVKLHDGLKDCAKILKQEKTEN